MLTTNLLPLEAKKEIRLEESRRVVILLSVFLVVDLIAASLLLLPSYLALVIERRGLEDSRRIEEEASLKLGIKEKVVSARRVASVVNAVKNYTVKPSGISTLLAEFLQSSGQGVAVSFLSVKKTGEFTLIGRATTRKDLLGFEQRLREGRKFEDLSSPLSNIIRETDINFSLQGRLKSVFRF